MPVRARWWLLALVAALAVAVVVAGLAVVDARSRAADRSGAAGASAAQTVTPSGSPDAGGATTPAAEETYYGNRTLYPVPGGGDPVPPAGFVPVFTQHLGRHGARTSVPSSHPKRAAQLWRRASAAHALTPLGAQLGPDLDALDAETERLGLGRLTTVGRQEEEDLGRRAGARLADLWASAGEDDEVAVVTSGRTRAEQSAQSFVAGLDAVAPRLAVAKPRTDKRLLYFDSTDPAYRAFLDDDRTWRRAYAAAVRGTDLRAAAEDVLGRLYTPSFVASVDDPTAAAASLYEQYRSAPSLSSDLRTPVDLRPFFPAADAAAFAFVEDARYFYSRGPGVTGDGRSHEAAQVLVDDFLTSAAARLAGGRTLAVLQFAHAEEVAPLAALLELPGSRPLASAAQVYSWSDSDFRTARVVPLAATIDWTVWRDRGGSVLVSVAENEVPTTLGRGCRPVATDPGYYRLTELRRCLAAR